MSDLLPPPSDTANQIARRRIPTQTALRAVRSPAPSGELVETLIPADEAEAREAATVPVRRGA